MVEGDDKFDVDAKPTSCPNPFEIDRETGNISIAIVGEGTNYPLASGPGFPGEVEFYVDLTPGEIWLEGPLGPDYRIYPDPDRFEAENVVSPYWLLPDPEHPECMACVGEDQEIDNILDLTMKFYAE
jgi:hypothetical protein